ncbi:MAG: VWA domain-containing protein [Rikenellaceae bacterium]|nr:VWA domain-containing protein [Rikenellaceae bacterium]MCL2692542.1 VWA domain-containing protein [Rikenellaceae bacterium]
MDILNITRFADPAALWLLAIVPLMVAYYVYRLRRGGAAIRISTTAGIDRRRTVRYWLQHVPFMLRCFAVAFMVVAIARPQAIEFESTSTTEGIDIVLAIDISGSMLARDFTPNRMEAAKQTAAQFIVDRPNDRFGVVAFAGESYTISPLTTDRRTLQRLITQIRIGVIDDGTAIGNGLATAINRLRDSEAASRVIILLSDGENNAGQIAPLTAAEIARSYGIRIYTVGIGTHGVAPMPYIDRWGRMAFMDMPVEIDEEMLSEIAAMTGGKYFRAIDNTSLSEIYESINALERTIIETNEFTRYHELFARFALAALTLLVLGFLLRSLILRRLT